MSIFPAARLLSRIPSRVSRTPARSFSQTTILKSLELETRLGKLETTLQSLRTDVSSHMEETKSIRSLLEDIYACQGQVHTDLKKEIDDVDSSFSRLEIRMDRILQGIEEEEALLKEDVDPATGISPNCRMSVGETPKHEMGGHCHSGGGHAKGMSGGPVMGSCRADGFGGCRTHGGGNGGGSRMGRVKGHCSL